MAELERLKTGYPTIAESEFKKYVKALVSPDSTVEERKAWLDVCIDPRLRVTVVDDVTGEPIHEVPPITYTSDQLTGKNVSGMIKEWIMMNEVSPLHGARYAEQHVTKDLIKGKPPEEDVKLWQWIIDRYIENKSNTMSTDAIDPDLLEDSNDW